MSDRRVTNLHFPAAGLYRRVGFQKHSAKYFSCDALNTWPDPGTTERERGGQRPGLGKSHSTLLGSGSPVRMLTTLQYQTTAFANQVKLLAVSNGTLFQESAPGVMSSVTSALSLSSDRVLQSADRDGELVIADDQAAATAKADDGVLASNGTSFTSATIGNFSTAGVSVVNMLLVITEHDGIDAVQTITLTATGGVWRARFGDYSTDPLAFDITAANLEAALEGLASIGEGNVSVTGDPGGPFTVTFEGLLEEQEVELITVDDRDLTGTDPEIVVAHDTVGATTTRWGGSWQMASVSGTTITLTRELRELTGIKFYIQRAPKVYRGDSNVLSLLLTEDDEEGNPLGFTPVGRPLVTRWRDRIVFAGGKYTPHLWEMSRQGNPRDFDYGADPEDVGRAVAGQVSDAGQLGEPITAIIPHNNVCLIFGCASSLWIMRGDPAYGGQIDRLSAEIGILSANAWCYTAEEYLFFLSRDGLYMMGPGCGSTPKSISRELLPKELLNIDPTVYSVSMAYDVRYRGVHLFVTKNSDPTIGTHWFIDIKQTLHGDATTAAFWPVKLASTDFEPLVVHARRNFSSDYSWCLLGCRDGYLRRFQHNLATDDGTAFDSYVVYGPMRAAGNDYVDGMVHEIVGDLPVDSGALGWSVQVGETAEGAIQASPCASGRWVNAGVQYPATVRRRGRYYAVKLTGQGAAWEIEGLHVTTSDQGRQRKV